MKLRRSKIDGYEITRIFETLDKQDNINRDTLIKLEWFIFHC